MKKVIIQVSVAVQYDDTQLAHADIEKMLEERATAFLYPAGLTVVNATAKVKRIRKY